MVAILRVMAVGILLSALFLLYPAGGSPLPECRRCKRVFIGDVLQIDHDVIVALKVGTELSRSRSGEWIRSSQFRP